MPALSRRLAIQQTLCSAAIAAATPWPILGCGGASSDELSSSERAAMQSVAANFMAAYDVPGVTVAILRGDAVLYNEAFGFANHERSEALSPASLFRIASVSKPITSAAIFTLVEKGKLRLADKVFGPGALLGTDYGKPPYSAYLQAVTVDHLLTHSAGGWPNDDSDPMFRFPQFNHAQLISWAVDHLPLENAPGEHFAYSNFGYCVLGRIIEKVAQMPYADYVRQQVFTPCKIDDMRISGNTLAERASGEVTYYGQNGENPYDMNVARMDSHGGWLATAVDLARFAGNVGGRHPSFLGPESIAAMTTPGPAPQSGEVKYARGWLVRNEGKGNWWHNGSLPGTTTIMVHTATGFSWAALANTRRQPANDINLALDKMVWDIARQPRSWKP
jgi:CubicO group peptidase (beta-lactamase class C family)